MAKNIDYWDMGEAEHTTAQPQAGAAAVGVDYWDIGEQPKLQQAPVDARPPDFGDPIQVDFSTELIAGLSDDPAERSRQIAKQVGVDPSLVGIVGDKTMLYDPTTKKLHPVESSGVQQFAAQTLGKAPTIAGAAVGELAGVPLGPVGMTTLPAAGAAAGEYARQKLGEYLTGDPVSAGEIGLESALGMFGGGLASLDRSYAMRKIARDVSKLDTPTAKAVQDSAKRWGIELTPAEFTGLPSLIDEQRLLSQLDTTSDIIGKFKGKQREQISKAMNDFLDTISLEKSVLEGNLSGVQAAATHIEDLKKARGVAAKPYYESARGADISVDVKGVLDTINDYSTTAVGRTKETLNKIRGLLFKEEKVGDKTIRTPITDIATLDNVKREIDDMIGVAGRKGENNLVRQLKGVKDTLVDSMDAQSWEYNQARKTFAEHTKPIEEAEGGVVGIISRLKDEQAKRAGKILFDSEASDPSTVLKARMAIQRTNPAAWDDLVRAHISGIMESKIKDTAKGYGYGGRLRSALFGSDKQRQILRTALDKKQYEALDDLMSVLEASARATQLGSPTVPKGETLKRLESESSGPIRKFVKSIFNPLSIPKKIESAVDSARNTQYLNDIAQTIVDPKKQQELRKLRVLSTSEKYFKPAMEIFLLQTLGAGAQAGQAMTIDAPLRSDADYIEYIKQNYGAQ